jgi:hypothetical protein
MKTLEIMCLMKKIDFLAPIKSLNPLVRGTDPRNRIRTRTKMSRIPISGSQKGL